MATLRTAVDLTYSGGGGPGSNIWHINTGESGDDQAAVTAAGVLLENFYETLHPGVISGNVTISHGGIWVDVESAVERSSLAWSIAGAAGVALAPPALALCVSWRTGTAARSGVGRTFLGPVAEASLDSNGTPTSTALLTITQATTALVSANTAAFPDFPGLGVYSRQNGTFRQFSGSRVRDQFASLRSRRD